MTSEEIQKLMAHFESWSGGFSPDSEQEIFIYVEYAHDSDADSSEVTQFLREWMMFAWRQPEQVSSPCDDLPKMVWNGR